MRSPSRTPPKLIAAGGLMIRPSLLAAPWVEALSAEAREAFAAAEEQVRETDDASSWRGGNPRRRLLSAPGGEVQSRVYADAALRAHLGRLCGRTLEPAGEQGTYSYYLEPGHHLGLHRDIPGCEVAMITCLDRAAGAGDGGDLRTYPGAFRADLRRLRARRPRGFRDVRLQPGETLLLLGGYVPHEVLPAPRGYRRVISVLCFGFQRQCAARR